MQAAHVRPGAAAARGDWHADAHAPLLVSDPLNARWLLGLDKIPPTARARARHEHGIMPYSLFMRAIPRLDFGARAALEKLCSDPRLLWSDDWHNIVVNQGLNDLLNVTLGGTAPDTTWFVGLTDGTPTVVAADTPASHAGWVEIVAFDEAARMPWVIVASTAQSITNSAAPAAFTISANGTTIGGAGLFGDNAKGGTAGRLYAAGAFSAGDKSLDDNDSLTVTITATTAAV